MMPPSPFAFLHTPPIPHPSIITPPHTIAEIGTAHNGSLSRAIELVDAAAEAGADIVKIQVVFAREILPPQVGLIDLQSGPVDIFQHFLKLEKTADFFQAIAERTKKKKIGFLGSAFGPASIKILKEIGVQAWKIASPELNHEELLEELARTGQPIIMSTGVSLHSDIQRSLKHIHSTNPSEPGKNQPQKNPVTLLHCITCYPAPEEESNLRLIPHLAHTFNCPIGLSDHSVHPTLIPSLAAAMGATVIEKHIRLEKKTDNLDDPVSLSPADFTSMVKTLKNLKGQSPPDVIAKLRRIYSPSRIEAALGSGIKTLAPSETPIYGRTNRSLHAAGPLKAGTVITSKNTAILRTEKKLCPGLPPHQRRQAYGRRLIRNIAPGNGINWTDLEGPPPTPAT